MDASQYKDHVLVPLFVKYVSNKYAGDSKTFIDVPPDGSFADRLNLMRQLCRQVEFDQVLRISASG
jgi:hypothetical protein